MQDTIGLTMPAMTAWMDKELRGVQMATTVHSLLNTWDLYMLWTDACSLQLVCSLLSVFVVWCVMCDHAWQPWSWECIGYRDLCVTAQYRIKGVLTLGIDPHIRCCCNWCDMQFQCAGWPAISQNTRQFAKQLLCMGKNQSWAQAGGVYDQRQRAAAPRNDINQDQSATWLNCTALCLSSAACFTPAYEPLTTILCYPCLQCTKCNAQQLTFTACLVNAIFVLWHTAESWLLPCFLGGLKFGRCTQHIHHTDPWQQCCQQCNK